MRPGGRGRERGDTRPRQAGGGRCLAGLVNGDWCPALQLGPCIFGNPAIDAYGAHPVYTPGCSAVRIFVHRTDEIARGRLPYLLPLSNPARFGVHQRDNSVKLCRGVRFGTVRGGFLLQMLVGWERCVRSSWGKAEGSLQNWGDHFYGSLQEFGRTKAEGMPCAARALARHSGIAA